MADTFFPADSAELSLPLKTLQQMAIVSTGVNSQVRVTSTPTFTRGCVLKAKRTNAQSVFIGGVEVSTSNGLELAAGEGVHLDINDLKDVWIVFSGASDEVRILYGK